jgi:hypothetical protein
MGKIRTTLEMVAQAGIELQAKMVVEEKIVVLAENGGGEDGGPGRDDDLEGGARGDEDPVS